MFRGYGQGIVGEIGSGSAHVRQSRGDRVPRKAALRMLAPGGWRVDATSAGNPRVIWKAGPKATWAQVLNTIGRGRANLRFLIDWNNHVLYATKGHGSTVHPLLAIAVKADAADAHKAKAKTSPTWVIDPNESIQANFDAWGKKAGWTVLWQGQTWMPAARTVFTGSFLHAVRATINALRAQGGDIRANAFGNHVLAVHTAAGESGENQ